MLQSGHIFNNCEMNSYSFNYTIFHIFYPCSINKSLKSYSWSWLLELIVIINQMALYFWHRNTINGFETKEFPFDIISNRYFCDSAVFDVYLYQVILGRAGLCTALMQENSRGLWSAHSLGLLRIFQWWRMHFHKIYVRHLDVQNPRRWT